MHQSGTIALLQPLDILRQISDLLFQVIGQYDNISFESLVYLTPAKHPPKIVRTAIQPRSKQRTKHKTVDHDKISQYRIVLQLVQQPVRHADIRHMQRVLAVRKLDISIRIGCQCRIRKRGGKEFAVSQIPLST